MAETCELQITERPPLHQADLRPVPVDRLFGPPRPVVANQTCQLGRMGWKDCRKPPVTTLRLEKSPCQQALQAPLASEARRPNQAKRTRKLKGLTCLIQLFGVDAEATQSLLGVSIFSSLCSSAFHPSMWEGPGILTQQRQVELELLLLPLPTRLLVLRRAAAAAAGSRHPDGCPRKTTSTLSTRSQGTDSRISTRIPIVIFRPRHLQRNAWRGTWKR